jgi:hypothetical protein
MATLNGEVSCCAASWTCCAVLGFFGKGRAICSFCVLGLFVVQLGRDGLGFARLGCECGVGGKKIVQCFVFLLKLCVWFLFICSQTMAMAAMEVVSAGGFSGVGF